MKQNMLLYMQFICNYTMKISRFAAKFIVNKKYKCPYVLQEQLIQFSFFEMNLANLANLAKRYTFNIKYLNLSSKCS